MKQILPDVARTQHTAVLGKTGSGKTSTAKLIVEQEAERGSRVCILDPVKSDWWGLTSSADGNSPGLPFCILGGPRAHVPLHETSGKAIGELVASGALPLSVIDMAFFNPGGHQQFFVDFAATLMRRMKGVLYLVIEEAHIFAPKERAGIGAENMAIHWAKMLATAGRTKGVRLIMATQRTQALHNALLGSCDTIIAHRFTAPADQKPILDWLKENVKDKKLSEQIDGSLSSLSTGQGWLCSGEARVFELVSFPRITTYDNTATPTDDSEEREVATATIDLGRLRAIIGDAVKDAEENDPKALRQRISELERQLTGKKTAVVPAPKAISEAETRGFNLGREAGYRESLKRTGDKVLELHEFTDRWMNDLESIAAGAWIKAPVHVGVDLASGHDIQAEALVEAGRVVDAKVQPSKRAPAARAKTSPAPPSAESAPQSRPAGIKRTVSTATPRGTNSETDDLPSGEYKILVAIAERRDGATRESLVVLTGYKRSSRNAYLQRLSGRGFIEIGDRIRATAAGIEALGTSYKPLPKGKALRERWLQKLPDGEAKIFASILKAWPNSIDREFIREASGYKRSSCNAYLQRLAARELITSSADGVRASEALFG